MMAEIMVKWQNSQPRWEKNRHFIHERESHTWGKNIEFNQEKSSIIWRKVNI